MWLVDLKPLFFQKGSGLDETTEPREAGLCHVKAQQQQPLSYLLFIFQLSVPVNAQRQRDYTSAPPGRKGSRGWVYIINTDCQRNKFPLLNSSDEVASKNTRKMFWNRLFTSCENLKSFFLSEGMFSAPHDSAGMRVHLFLFLFVCGL